MSPSWKSHPRQGQPSLIAHRMMRPLNHVRMRKAKREPKAGKNKVTHARYRRDAKLPESKERNQGRKKAR